MNTIELEVQKANLAREILTTTDENLINNMLSFIKNFSIATPKKEISQKRDIGFLKGKAEVVFHDDWSMTPEELDMV